MNPAGRDKLLFTPGPLTTSLTVKQAMLHDHSSREPDFIALVRGIREQLLAVAGVSREHGYEAIPMQGSGTFAVEAVISSVIPRDGKLLAVVNGAYGERIAEMAGRHGIPVTILRSAEDESPDLEAIDRALTADAGLTHVAAVHCETTSGILNPAEAIGRIAARHRRSYLVDAMSSFGALPLDLRGAGVDYLISSANKCIEGVPGFAFVIARRDALFGIDGRARTLSLDLFAQWQGLEKTGQFRFTPPTHALLAFAQALRELDAEGGVPGRARRYQANHDALLRGMSELGFRPYLKPEVQSCIITTFHYPADTRFHFEKFYAGLAARGFIIYPGKLTKLDCFRIGTIGRIGTAEVEALLAAIRGTLEELGLPVPLVS